MYSPAGYSFARDAYSCRFDMIFMVETYLVLIEFRQRVPADFAKSFLLWPGHLNSKFFGYKKTIKTRADAIPKFFLFPYKFNISEP